MLSKGLEGGLGLGSVVLRGVKAARDCYSPMAIFPSCGDFQLEAPLQNLFRLRREMGSPAQALAIAQGAAGGPPALPGARPV